MEDQTTTWKGHSFTLLIFTGIVVLCSIFFILGMLVGRQQGQKIAAMAAAEPTSLTEIKAEQVEEKPKLTFYDVDKNQRPRLEPAPVPAPERAKRADPLPAPQPRNVVNFQVGVFSQSARAETVFETLKKKGFKAFILAPAPGERNPVYRVQVGPFDSKAESDLVKKKLEAEGYKPILKQ
jgi:cell division septation protein DedD